MSVYFLSVIYADFYYVVSICMPCVQYCHVQWHYAECHYVVFWCQGCNSPQAFVTMFVFKGMKWLYQYSTVWLDGATPANT
jgi:hypothetical protein